LSLVTESYVNAGYIIAGKDKKPVILQKYHEDLFLKTRKSLLLVCDKDRTAADILDLLIGLTEWRAGKNESSGIFYTENQQWITMSLAHIVDRLFYTVSKNTVIKALRLLEEKGLISKRDGIRSPTIETRSSNRYRVNQQAVRIAHEKAIDALRTKNEAIRGGVYLTDDEAMSLSPFYINIQSSVEPQIDTSAPLFNNEQPVLSDKSTSTESYKYYCSNLNNPCSSKNNSCSEVSYMYKYVYERVYEDKLAASDVKDVDILTQVEYANRVVSASEDLNDGFSSSDRSSGNKENLLITEPQCQGIIDIERLGSVKELDSIQTSMQKNATTKTDAVTEVDPRVEENSSRQEDAPKAQLFIQESGNMEDVEIFIKAYHKRIPLRDRSSSKNRESKNVGGLLKANGDKVEKLLESYSVDDLLEGLDGFIADDYWKGQGYPMRGYLSQVAKYCSGSPQDESDEPEVRRYQKTETIEPCPASASNSTILDSLRQARVKSRALELKRIADRCGYQLDIDLGDTMAVESNFGPVLDAFRSKLGFDYPVTTKPCLSTQT